MYDSFYIKYIKVYSSYEMKPQKAQMLCFINFYLVKYI